MKTISGRDAPKEDDDLIGKLLERHPGFRQMLQRRLGEKSVSVREARRRLRQRI